MDEKTKLKANEACPYWHDGEVGATHEAIWKAGAEWGYEAGVNAKAERLEATIQEIHGYASRFFKPDGQLTAAQFLICVLECCESAMKD